MKNYTVLMDLQDSSTGRRGDLETVYIADSIDSLQEMILADYGDYLLKWTITGIEEAA